MRGPPLLGCSSCSGTPDAIKPESRERNVQLPSSEVATSIARLCLQAQRLPQPSSAYTLMTSSIFEFSISEFSKVIAALECIAQRLQVIPIICEQNLNIIWKSLGKVNIARCRTDRPLAQFLLALDTYTSQHDCPSDAAPGACSRHVRKSRDTVNNLTCAKPIHIARNGVFGRD